MMAQQSQETSQPPLPDSAEPQIVTWEALRDNHQITSSPVHKIQSPVVLNSLPSSQRLKYYKNTPPNLTLKSQATEVAGAPLAGLRNPQAPMDLINALITAPVSKYGTSDRADWSVNSREKRNMTLWGRFFRASSVWIRENWFLLRILLFVGIACLVVLVLIPALIV